MYSAELSMQKSFYLEARLLFFNYILHLTNIFVFWAVSFSWCHGLVCVNRDYTYFSCINIYQVPWKLFEHAAVRSSVQTSSERPGKS